MTASTLRFEIGGESLCDLARELISKGADPEDVVEWTRGGKPVFEPLPLATWADWTVEESGYVPVHFVRYRPFAGGNWAEGLERDEEARSAHSAEEAERAADPRRPDGKSHRESDDGYGHVVAVLCRQWRVVESAVPPWQWVLQRRKGRHWSAGTQGELCYGSFCLTRRALLRAIREKITSPIYGMTRYPIDPAALSIVEALPEQIRV